MSNPPVRLASGKGIATLVCSIFELYQRPEKGWVEEKLRRRNEDEEEEEEDDDDDVQSAARPLG
ncbi:unnamed protein product [marine sediment metagenome]|uniref:Uncharacterized protein n=1 Tax=marine sediment metagenome TaxID=412755 RepID=X1UI31_9ZZZZ